MVSPSMLLIALVAAYPIGYAIWLSLHEYSVRVAGLSRWAGLNNYTEAPVKMNVVVNASQNSGSESAFS